MLRILASFLSVVLILTSFNLRAGNDTFMDYQNYNHGYCPDCNCYPCRCAEEGLLDVDDELEPEPAPVPAAAPVPAPAPTPCGAASTCAKPDPCNAAPAPICGTNCGISLVIVGLVVAGVAAAGAIIVSSNVGGRASH